MKMNTFNSFRFCLKGFLSLLSLLRILTGRLTCFVPRRCVLGTTKAKLVCFLWFGVFALQASDRYVVAPGTGGTNEGPYTSWAIAATQVQWAVDAATNAGDTVWVSNGVYVLTNQISVISNIVLRSTNGPDVTIVNGGFVAGAPDATTNNRCLYLSNSSAFVSGFTFSNGAVCAGGGGGVWMADGTLSNCTVRDNIAYSLAAVSIHGGGIYISPRGTVTTCRVTGNITTNATVSSSGAGAGILGAGSAWFDIFNCLISNNTAYAKNAATYGAGIQAGKSGSVRSCMICNNTADTVQGGGIYMNSTTTILADSTVAVNSCYSFGGCFVSRGTITNCVISDNNYFAPSAGNIYLLNTTFIGSTNKTIPAVGMMEHLHI